jgi:hypothetical protein
MKRLSEGEHDAVIIQQVVGLQLIKKLGISNVVSVSTFPETSLKPVARPLSGFEQKFCLAVRDGDHELLALLNEGLAIVSANGIYNELYNKWFSPILPRPPIPLTLILKYLLFILGPILFLLSIVGLWYLNREVAKKTRSLREEIKDRKKAEKEKEKLIVELKKAIYEVKTLGGLLPICASCKKIRDDKGYWNQLESYIRQHSNAEFSHSVCPDCAKELYPELDL